MTRDEVFDLSALYNPYSLDKMIDLLSEYKSERNRPDLMPPKAQGRNEPCMCGSGKKYKKCCGIWKG